jgi:hypothetical protein
MRREARPRGLGTSVARARGLSSFVETRDVASGAIDSPKASSLRTSYHAGDLPSAHSPVPRFGAQGFLMLAGVLATGWYWSECTCEIEGEGRCESGLCWLKCC